MNHAKMQLQLRPRQKVGGRAGQPQRVSARPRWLLRGEGHKEGDPQTGADEQEQDDRGAGQVGGADLPGDGDGERLGDYADGQ